jgi:RNA-directed DNA polymerase
MAKGPIGLQDLRRSMYVKAKAEPSWRFWGLYVHVCRRDDAPGRILTWNG